MAEDRVEQEKKIQDIFENMKFDNLPEEVLRLMTFFSEISLDDELIEKLEKEIVKKHGE